jgi:hypothetical protein
MFWIAGWCMSLVSCRLILEGLPPSKRWRSPLSQKVSRLYHVMRNWQALCLNYFTVYEVHHNPRTLLAHPNFQLPCNAIQGLPVGW